MFLPPRVNKSEQNISTGAEHSSDDIVEVPSPLTLNPDDYFIIEPDGSIRPPSPDRAHSGKIPSEDDEVVVYMGKNGQAYVYDGYSVTKTGGTSNIVEEYFYPRSPTSLGDEPVIGSSFMSNRAQPDTTTEQINEMETQTVGETTPPETEDAVTPITTEVAESTIDPTTSTTTSESEIQTTPPPTTTTTVPETESTTPETTTTTELSTTVFPFTLNGHALLYLKSIARLGVVPRTRYMRSGIGLMYGGIGFPFIAQRLVTQSNEEVDGGYYTDLETVPSLAPTSSQVLPGELPHLFLLRRPSQVRTTTESSVDFEHLIHL